MSRDNQKQRVYDWENDWVKEGQIVTVNQAKKLVNYIWANEGYEYPPAVRAMPKQNRTIAGQATRTCIWFEQKVCTRTVIHEVAHALTMDMDGNCPADGGHGPTFMGVYMKLLSEYMDTCLFVLMHTAEKANVKFDVSARPVIAD